MATQISLTTGSGTSTITLSTGARGPAGADGTGTVNNATVNAAIEESPGTTRTSLELGNAATLTVDADLATFSLPASTTISAFGATLVDDASASTARTTLGLGTAATTAATDYATSTQGTKADAALPKAGGTMTGTQTFASGSSADFSTGSVAFFNSSSEAFFFSGSFVYFYADTIKLQGTTFATSLNFVDPASAKTITFPDATGTVTLDTATQTLTNKTLTGAALNGTVGATTPSTGAFTTLSATGNLTIDNGAASRVSLDASTQGGYIIGVDGLEFYGASGTKFIDIQDTAGVVNFPSAVTVNGAVIATLTGVETLTNKTLTAPTVTGYTESVVAIGTVTTTNTISLTSGTVQTATLTASTACVFTMPTATAGRSFVLYLKQAATTGLGTATFTSVKWAGGTAPTITATAGKMDILSFVADGTNWYGSAIQNFTP